MSPNPTQEKTRPREARGFETALRSDLARAPPLAYEARVGGLAKRAFDVCLTLLLMPAWLTGFLIALLVAMARGAQPVFRERTCVGYGGRSFQQVTLDFDRPADAKIVALTPRRPAVLRAIAERLPQMVSVLRGDMSLVGPAPLTRGELARVKAARRAYLSARPGIIGISGEANDTSACRRYALTWSLAEDISIIVRALRTRPVTNATGGQENPATKRDA